MTIGRHLSRHWALALLVLVAVSLRVLALIAIAPGIWFSDSNGYVQAAATGTLSLTRPVGYSLFVAPFWHLQSAAALIVVQHLLGLGLVVGLYALLVHRGAPRWLATLGVVPAALDLYLVVVEHTMMAETIFHVTLASAIGLVMWREKPGLAAVAAAGALVGYAGLVRSVGVPMFAVFCLYLIVRRVGWRAVVAFVAAGVAVTAAYATIFDVQHGSFAVSSSSGRFLYGKVAPFADCAKLHGLPASERALCPDPTHRMTPNAYTWSAESPIHGLQDYSVARAFAVRVIRQQPGDYASVVAGGFLHYFRPGHHIGTDDYPVQPWQFPADPRTWSYPGYRGPIRAGDAVRSARHPITQPNRYVAHMSGAYRFSPSVTRLLHDVQTHVYTPGPLLALCVLLVLAGLAARAGEGRLRADAALLSGAALAALAVSQALSVFSYRYGFGLIVFLPVSAVLAATALRERWERAPMTHTLVISDLHLGSRLGRDVLRRPAVLEVLLAAVREADRLVLLGDVVELLEGRGRKAMAAASPVLSAIGAALGPERQVILVPGNHDHALVRPWVRERMAAGRGLGLATRVPVRSSRWLAQVAEWLRPAKVEVRYPGVWLADRTWATHGHYLDRHLLPELGWATRQLFGAIPEHRARAEDYETSTGAGNAALAGLSSVGLPWGLGESFDLVVQASHRVAALAVPVAGHITRGTLAPLSAGALGFQFRRTGLPAMTSVAQRLRVPADHVIFGHLHRAGPLPTDVEAEWAQGGPRLHNTGSWVYEPLILAGAHAPHPYWPGSAIVVPDDAPPRSIGLLDEQPSGALH